MENAHSPSFPLRIGTRASALARWQAEFVAAALRAEGEIVELVFITTAGDARQFQTFSHSVSGDNARQQNLSADASPSDEASDSNSVPSNSAPSNTAAVTSADGMVGADAQGLFTKEIQQRLLLGEIDLAVHSLKDLPTEEVAGLTLAATPERGPSRDVFVSHRFASFHDLPEGAVVGTGSRRRRAQLLALRPDLLMREIRGNIDTRLNKMARKDYDALVLAEAGLERLKLQVPHISPFSPEEMLPAVGQGVLGIEIRAEDSRTSAAVAKLNHPATMACALAERTMLKELRGGCLAPVAAHTQVLPDGSLQLIGAVFGPRGTPRLIAQAKGPAEEPMALGIDVAQRLHKQGAQQVIQAARESP